MSKTLNKNHLLDEVVTSLYLCADILTYPEEGYKKKIDKLLKLLKNDKKYNELSTEDIQAEFINIFNMNSTSLKCVPYASWWIDGKMSANSLGTINKFYEKCGYKFDTKNMKQPADHISFMIRFVAILAEEGKFQELKEFSNFLTWMDKFADSLDRATNKKFFKLAVNLATKKINYLKEVA